MVVVKVLAYTAPFGSTLGSARERNVYPASTYVNLQWRLTRKREGRRSATLLTARELLPAARLVSAFFDSVQILDDVRIHQLRELPEWRNVHQV